MILSFNAGHFYCICAFVYLFSMTGIGLWFLSKKIILKEYNKNGHLLSVFTKWFRFLEATFALQIVRTLQVNIFYIHFWFLWMISWQELFFLFPFSKLSDRLSKWVICQSDSQEMFAINLLSHSNNFGSWL
jgi:hypothetical protein